MLKTAVRTPKRAKKIRKVKRLKADANNMGSLEKFRRMATVIQDSNDAITFQDLDGNILAWNRGAEQIYGYSELEALSMNIVDTVPTEYQEEAREFLASLKRGELVSTLETKRKTKDGRIVDVWLTNTKLTDDKGKLKGIATTERDISERKQSEASLREKFRELEYLREGQIALSELMRGEQIISKLGQSILRHLVPFTNAQVGAFYVLVDKEKLQMVAGYALGKTEGPEKVIEFGEGLIGQVAIEKRSLVIEDIPAAYFNKIGSTLGQMNPRSLLICPILYESEVIGVIELGSLHSFSEHQRVFLSHVSENIGIAINTSDVRKKVQKQNEALNKAQVLLEEKATEVQRASRYKTEFLANMSHELRTPLNSSLILAKLLMENSKGNLTDEQIQYATSIHSSSKDLLNLINDILDLSKVEAGKLDIRAEKVVFRTVIDGLKQTFGATAKEKKLSFEVQEDAGLPKYLITDRQRLEQILKNLISNALKFTDTGAVKIRVFTASNERIAFEVSDSGIGIPKEQQAIIFEAFMQADGTTNRKYGGTGLGLSISRDLAKLLEGNIEVESTVGKGSRFTLYLPVAFGEIAVATVPEISSSTLRVPLRRNGVSAPAINPFFDVEDDRGAIGELDKTFLIIEDDNEFAKILSGVAHELNFKCIIGQGADEGIELALEYGPQAIFLDVRLPDHTGLTVLDRLKKNRKTRHIPVYVMSSEDFRSISLQMGAIGFMSKPVERDEIVKCYKRLEDKFSRRSRKILVLDNDMTSRKAITDILGDSEIQLAFANSVSEALICLQADSFDCIIAKVESRSFLKIQMLEELVQQSLTAVPPIIAYSVSTLTHEQDLQLRAVSASVNLRSASTPESLFHQVALVLHRTELTMSAVQKSMIRDIDNGHHDFEGRKILVVDDDVRNIFAMTCALEEKGATIYVSRNGQEALDKLDEDPQIELVLMDIMMPEMDGYEATRRIRKQKRFEKLPIIAVTAKAMADDQAKCLEAGTDDYLSKPVDLEKLQSLVRVWINR